MANLSSNVTFNSDVCSSAKGFLFVFMSLIDIFPFLIGQPAVARILWITFTSKKAPDILNCNFAVFNNLHQLISIIHVTVLFSKPSVHDEILTFSLVFGQVGGPMSFFCICIERYVAVIYPMSYPLLKKYRFREISVVMIWFLSVSIALMCFLTDIASIRDEASRLLPLYVLGIMMGMMVHCSIKIARTLKESGPGTGKLNPAKRKAFNIVCATSNITFFCYAPIVFLQRLWIVRESVPECTVKVLCVMFLSIESVVYPLFYLSTQGQLRTCFKVKKER